MDTDPNITKLLRLKRYEQPPDAYFEGFLRDFHRRQRAQLLDLPWHTKVWESFLSIWPEFEVPRLAYAGVAAAALAAAGLILYSPSSGQSGLTASVPALRANLDGMPDLSLEPKTPVTISEALPVSARPGSPSQHYVLQPRPASNDRPLSF